MRQKSRVAVAACMSIPAYFDDETRHHHDRRRRTGRRVIGDLAGAARIFGRGVRAPARSAQVWLHRRTLHQPRTRRTRLAWLCDGRTQGTGRRNRRDDARPHGPSFGRPYGIAALRPRRQRSDLVGEPRCAQHGAARCSRSCRCALAFRSSAAFGGLANVDAPLRRRNHSNYSRGEHSHRRRRRRLRVARRDEFAHRSRQNGSNRSITATRNWKFRRATENSRWSRTRCTYGRAAITCVSRCRTPRIRFRDHTLFL